MDDGSTRQASNTSLIVRGIIISKSSNSADLVLCNITSCHLINTNLAEFYDQMSFLTSVRLNIVIGIKRPQKWFSQNKILFLENMRGVFLIDFLK